MHLHAITKFWQQHPALLYALAILLGIQMALAWHVIVLLPIAVLLVPMARQTLLAIALMIMSFFYVTAHYTFPQLPQEGIVGTAFIEITSVSSKTTHFGKQWSYRGTINRFLSSEGDLVARNVPYNLSISQKEDIKRPIADTSYKITAKLKELSAGYYSLNPISEDPWYPVNGTWSLAEWRFRAKQQVSQYIQDHLSSSQVATFLAGIATGDFDDRTMFFEFGRFGLQHIMAISGFHFAIIATILSGGLRLILSKKRATFFLIFLISSYFIFLGCGASIMRAWISILIVLFGYVLQRRGSGLNSLGIGMIAILFFDPLQCKSLGFQFSFITTAAILLFFPICDYLIQRLFKKRSLSKMLEMDKVNQHAYCLLSFFRQGLALTVAVNMIALPMTLHYFHKFPFLSLIYNLFFPFMVSISMLLLIVGIFFSLIIPPLGALVNALNQFYTQFMLNFIYNMPPSLDIVWRVPGVSSNFIIIYLTLVFTAGICLKHYLEEYKDTYQDFVFI